MVAEHLGGDSNHWEAFFLELERWEEVLSQLPDAPLDGRLDTATDDPLDPEDPPD